MNAHWGLLFVSTIVLIVSEATTVNVMLDIT